MSLIYDFENNDNKKTITSNFYYLQTMKDKKFINFCQIKKVSQKTGFFKYLISKMKK